MESTCRDMKTVYSADHAGHKGNLELSGGELVPCFELPQRAEMILDRIVAEALGPVVSSEPQSLTTARKLHDPDYVAALARIWPMWQAEGRCGSAIPAVFPVGIASEVSPQSAGGLLGFYSFDAGATFVEGTWQAIKASHDVALTGADLISAGERSAFALCRPPGHHAGRSSMGGYCYLNNAAIAAQRLLEEGAQRVTVLDIDYHHGNGTQEIFYQRRDVQVISIHADPRLAYPYFYGHANERGSGAGEDMNLNLPLPPGTDFRAWRVAFSTASSALADYAPDALVVSLGVDTYQGDPISQFCLQKEDYPRIGDQIQKLGLSTLFVMEGGYAVDDIGVNVAGVLTGFVGT